jgi:hypothetical protein
MKKIVVYDPPMCCSTGVCGPDIDPILPRFAGMLAQLEGQGIAVERHNLAQQPMAFAQNPEVRAFLEKEGPGGLPLIFVDDVLEIKGRYPELEERSAFIKRARKSEAASPQS